MKKRIFIGSSIEAKDLAMQLQKELEHDYECVLWYEDFFTLGSHYYTDLVQKIITFEYAIMIGAVDDKVTRISTRKKKKSPRDNIYLEYGLFSGILSPKRVFLLMHQDCMPASDLAGMSICMYDNNSDAVLKTKKWLNSFSNTTEFSAIDYSNIEILPTVGTAVGYFYNFLKKFSDNLLNWSELENYKDFQLTICIPNFICDDVKYYEQDLIERLHLTKDNICDFRILVDKNKNSILSMYDVPNTMLAIFKTVNYIFAIGEGQTPDTICAKHRALNNFYEIISSLIEAEPRYKRFIKVIRYPEVGTIE